MPRSWSLSLFLGTELKPPSLRIEGPEGPERGLGQPTASEGWRILYFPRRIPGCPAPPSCLSPRGEAASSAKTAGSRHALLRVDWLYLKLEPAHPNTHQSPVVCGLWFVHPSFFLLSIMVPVSDLQMQHSVQHPDNRWELMPIIQGGHSSVVR